jgi:hypothetical protein
METAETPKRTRKKPSKEELVAKKLEAKVEALKLEALEEVEQDQRTSTGQRRRLG